MTKSHLYSALIVYAVVQLSGEYRMLEQIHYKVSWRKWLLRDLKSELELASIRDEEKECSWYQEQHKCGLEK